MAVFDTSSLANTEFLTKGVALIVTSLSPVLSS